MLVHLIIYLECFPDPGVNKNEYNDYIVALQKVSPYNQKCTGLDDCYDSKQRLSFYTQKNL